MGYQQSWFCHVCGQRNRQHASYCGQCGEVNPAGATLPPQVQPLPVKRRSIGRTFSIGCLGLIGFIFVASTLSRAFLGESEQIVENKSPVATPTAIPAALSQADRLREIADPIVYLPPGGTYYHRNTQCQLAPDRSGPVRLSEAVKTSFDCPVCKPAKILTPPSPTPTPAQLAEEELPTVSSPALTTAESSSGGSYSPSYSPRRTPGKDVYVRGYTRKDGTHVRAHTRSRKR